MLALLAAAGATLSACAPTPEPSPTPTAAFASEQEAFAAAEETYRAYNDAVNRQRDGEETDPQSFLIALALENDIDGTRVLEENGVHISGHGDVSEVRGTTADLESVPATITMLVCLDVSATRVLNADDEDVTPTDRPEAVALDVKLVSSGDGLKISESTENTADQC